MIYNTEISIENQIKWFESINNKHNFYFLIEYDNKFIGLINGKNVDYTSRTMEGGIFLWDTKYWKSHIPVIASIIMNDCNFLISNFNFVFAQVLRNNRNAVKYNMSMGYEIVKETKNIVIMRLSRENYIKKSKKLRRAIGILYKDFDLLSLNDITIEEEKKQIDLLYSDLPNDIQDNIDRIIIKK